MADNSALTPTQTLQIEEYKALRKEIELSIDKIYTQEQYAFVAIGLLWGWLISHRLTNFLLWLLPVLVLVVMYARIRNMSREIYAMGDHISKIV